MSPLPTGTVTFLFTDIEGSTKLLQRLGELAADVFEQHGSIMRDAIAGAAGVVVRTEGDSFFAVFSSGPAAVAAAVAAQRALSEAAWPEDGAARVRMGLHSGEGVLGGDDYLGLDVHRAARIAASAHGGQIVVSDATRALADGVADVGYVDLGEHRFKDLRRPERVFQVVVQGLPSEFPPLGSLSAVPNNLPLELTSFVDRPEVAVAGALLEHHRLLTLTGPGGTGKTRLSLQIAAERADRYDGVFFVPLDAVDAPSMVATTIAAALGLSQSAGDPAQRLAQHLAGRAYLLVLDNFEQVLDAAPLVADLLRASPGLHVIVTSRAALRIAGEQEFAVPPLGVPNGKRDVATLRTIGSVALFVERATAARPEFALDATNAGAVAEIARRLDGLPLAIELAAARVKLLPPQTMLERLGSSLDFVASNRRDLPDRQRTLRGAITWSYDLLSPPEKRLLRLLAVFRGGATLEVVEEVCGRVTAAEEPLLNTLEALVDHSLVRPEERAGETRFTMLETIREYAWEALQDSDECSAVERAHLDTFVEVAERLGPRLTSIEQTSVLERLDAERDNLRGALGFAVSSRAAEPAHRLAAAFWRYWHMRGLVPEGRQLLDGVLTLDPADPARRARSYEAAGGLAYWANDMPGARDNYSRALEEAEASGDRDLIGFAHYNLAFPTMMDEAGPREPKAAIPALDRAEAIFEETGNRLGLASVSWARGIVAVMNQDFVTAVETTLAASALFAAEGDAFMEAWSNHQAVVGYLRLDRAADAAPLARQLLEVFGDTGDVSGVTLTLGNLAFIAAHTGHEEQATRMWGAVKALAGRSGVNLLDASDEWLGLSWKDLPMHTDPADRRRWESAGQSLDTSEAIALGHEIIALVEAPNG